MNATETSLRRDPGTALHRQLFMVLRDQIAQGVYAEGDAIPPEDDLCRRFGVSRITVRRAVADLEQLGLVEKRQGRGTFVRAAARKPRPQATLGLIDALSKTARETEVQVLSFETGPAPAAIAAQLDLAEGEIAMHAVRLRSSQGVPLLVTDAWVPGPIGARITAAALQGRALYEILMDQGVKFGRVVQEVTAVAADPRLAGLLQTDIGAPLLRLVRLLYDRRRKPVQYLTIHATSERTRMLMDVSAGAVNTVGAGQLVHDMQG